MLVMVLLIVSVLSSDSEASNESDVNGERCQHTWIVNIGNKEISGNKIADMIMKLEKKAKYLPEDLHCFDQWIALRELQCDHLGHNGRIRCAIKLAPFPRTGRQWLRAEWGWNPSKKYIAYEIIAVRLFRMPVTTYSVQGSPFHVSTSERYIHETQKILLGIETGLNATTKLFGTLQQVTYERLKARQQKKILKRIEISNITFYKREFGNCGISYHCCVKKLCVDSFKCSILQVEADIDTCELFQWIRNCYHDMSRYHQREFIAERVVFANSDLNIKQNQYFLEPLQILRYYLTAAFLPIRPSCCRKFFQWMLAVTIKSINQQFKVLTQ